MNVTPKFKLNKPKEKRSSILLKVYFNKKRFTWGLGSEFLINTELWSSESMKTIKGGSAKERKPIATYKRSNPHIELELENIDTRIASVKREVKKYFSQCELQDVEPSKEDLKKTLNAKFKAVDNNKSKESISEFTKDFITKLDSGKATYKDRRGVDHPYKASTTNDYKQFLNYWNDFRGANDYTFNDVTIQMYEEFLQHGYNKELYPNTIGKRVKNWKAIMRRAHEEGLHQNLVYTFRKFKKISNDSDNVALTQDELDRMYSIDLNDKPKLDKVRDLFIIGCYTALRFSDFSRIKNENIKKEDGQYYLSMEATKGKKKVTIPLRPEVVNIAEKYNFNLPTITNQRLNEYIKEVCQLIEFNNLELKTIYKGNQEKKIKVERWKMISCHSSRRSGATLMYLSGIDPKSICLLTGHSSIEMLERYLKIDKTVNAKRLAKSEFFSPKPKLKVVS